MVTQNIDMKILSRACLVPFALVAMGLLTTVLSGCRKEEKKDAPAPSAPPPEEYMNDPVFRKALTEKRKEREGYYMSRTKLVQELEKMIEAKKAEMPGADDAALKAALEKDPAWNDLTKRVNDLTTAIGENRRKAQGIVRERLAPEKEISK